MIRSMAKYSTKNGVPGTVGRGAGALRGTLTEVGRHAAEGALVNLAFLGA
jgi:hypothetical protein